MEMNAAAGGEKRKALGRGLDALLPAARSTAAAAAAAASPATAEEAGEAVREIAVEKIERSPYQPRARMDEAALEELAASIREQGVMQPLLLRPLPASSGEGERYQLIAGERRWLAAQRAGRATVPAVVRQVSNEQAAEMALIENLQREDLGPMEQARAFDRLSREFGLTQEQIALRTGKERSTVANLVRLLRLPEQLQQGVENGVLSFGHAKALLMLASPEAQLKVARRVEEQHMSVRQTEDLVQSLIHPTERLPARPPAPVDPNVREAERQLERALGVRVRIKDRKGRGKIVLEYTTLEDFDRILEALGK